MAVYNTKEEWLRESIESILTQTLTDFEFIIINDGSTNNAEEVILSYKDMRIKYIKQENQGLAKSLNNGMDIAQGEYIARMDSDDISLPERFEKQISFLEKNPEISLVGTSYEMFPERKIVLHPDKVKFVDLLKGCFIAHPTVMFRKADFEKYNLKYNETFKAAQDYDLWSRAIRYLNFANLEEVLLKYRHHEESISVSKKEIQNTNAQKVRQNMLDFLTDDMEMQNRIKNAVFNNVIANSVSKKYSFWERIFSVKNSAKHKIITILGIHIKLKRNKK